uniref:Uncharacterized protein n=1 Tax=Acrobeloides nanus TaxID=290746 RepID=A0A914CEM5_9BILA
MKTWLEIPEDIFFKIKLYGVDEEWKNDFLHECNNFRLGHVNLEFPSRSRSSAHIKVKFHPDNSCCEIFPVIDLPAREPGQLACYARYFRDF